jgi:hypothetical protein
LNTIHQNIKLNCISNQPDIFYTEVINIPNSLVCKIILRDNINFEIVKSNLPQEPPKTIDLDVILETSGEKDTDKHLFKTTIKIPFTSSFKVRYNVKEINFFRNNRTNYIHLSNMNDLEISLSDYSVVQVETNPQEKYIKLYVPYNITDDFTNVKLRLDNRITGQHEEIMLKYSAEREQLEPTILGIKRSTLIDIMTFLLLVGCILIIYNYITSSEVNLF